MAKFISPVLGYNNNVRHKNRVFHIQTEDSGVNHPHIITHLFMDGGRILKSVKTSYAEHVGNEKMTDTVRQMMKDQHKAMFIALRDGQFDHLVDGGTVKAAAASGSKAPPAKAEPAKAEPAKAEPAKTEAEPAKTEAEPAKAEPAKRAPTLPPAAAAPAEGAPPTVAEPSPPAAPADPDATLEMAVAPASVPEGPFRALPSAIPPSTRDKLNIAAPAPPKLPRIQTPGMGTAASALADTPAAEPPPERRPSPPPVETAAKPPSARDLTMDFDALEQPAAREDGLYRSNDLPPPPANLFLKSGGSGSYSEHDKRKVLVPREEPESPAGVQPVGRPVSQPSLKAAASVHAQVAVAPAAPARSLPPDPRAEAAKGEPQRYAPARPASVFGATSNRPQPASIFSDELISDKSLDEVILSYLAEDLEPPQRK